jgi:hypothetical protein
MVYYPESQKAYYEKNKERIKAKHKQWRDESQTVYTRPRDRIL